MIKSNFIRDLVLVLTATVLVGFMPMSASALTEAELDMFAQNNILFYDPGTGSCGSALSSIGSSGSNRNYAGAEVWSQSELQAIAANQAIYEEAASKYDFPWQILAVVHRHETSLRRYNPSNGQGVYQLYSYTNGGKNENRFEPADSISEQEFRRQTFLAAEFIKSKVSDLSTSDNIKKLFFRYNGVSSYYIQKALEMGFTEEQAQNGEGSPYVMNRYDSKRDPSSSGMSPVWPGRYVADGVYNPTVVSNGFGAFVQYEALAGNSYCSDKSGTIVDTAILLSWKGHGHAKDDPKPEYVQAMKQIGYYYGGTSSGVQAPAGASCDQFVGTVMRYSGVDPEFPVWNPTSQETYMKSHPEAYMKVEANDDVANLIPGDIFVVDNTGVGRHIFLYIGEVDGKQSQASASFNEQTGEHYAGFPFYGYGMQYSIYRRIN